MEIPKEGVVAAGHTVTVAAAKEILAEGGNAFDAILAAFMTACVAEPGLTSLGGGGYMLAHTNDGKNELYDFFVQTPHSKNITTRPDFYPALVDFGSVTQEFHIGMASIAVPGGAAGVFAIHEELGSLPLARIAEPAVRAAREGVQVNAFHAHVFDLLDPIFKATPEAYTIYASRTESETLLREGEFLKNPAYGDFLEALVKEGRDLFYGGELAHAVAKDAKDKGGYITEKDFLEYAVEKREPLQVDYRGNTFITNPPPGSGGILIAFALRLLESFDLKDVEWGSAGHIELLANIMAATNAARARHVDGHLFDSDISELVLDTELLARYRKEVVGVTNHMGSTTHMSVIDGAGNAASMTTSNGEGSGYLMPGTGVMLNNMLGEEDLHPHGFHQWKEWQRISSMMSPSLLLRADGTKIALGSGGSNRIRTALLQTIINIVDRGMNLADAVESPRIHFERGRLDIEPGFESSEIDKVKKIYTDTHVHGQKGVFFGGVHAGEVNPLTGKYQGAGDKRRDGTSAILFGDKG